MTIKCLIIDDEPSAIEVLVGFIAKTSELTLVNSFRSPIEALSFLKENKVDLIFLDINMPQLTGMELAKILVDPPLIIFTTAYSEYALESYEKNALDYLLKPITFERFLIAANKAEKQLQNKTGFNLINTNQTNNNQETIYIKSGSKTHRILLNDVRYLEKEGHYITFFLHDKKVVARLSINEVFEIISENNFIQIHKSFIVSQSYVETIERHQIKIGAQYLPIGKTFRMNVHNHFKSDL